MSISTSLKVFLNLSRVQTSMSRRFDSYMDGLGLSDFIILYHLEKAPNQKLRRVDLAEKIGLTASGVTRQLLPMEKIGLVGHADNEGDARSKYVTLAPGGKRKLSEAIERAELFCQEQIKLNKATEINFLYQILLELGGNIR